MAFLRKEYMAWSNENMGQLNKLEFPKRNNQMFQCRKKLKQYVPSYGILKGSFYFLPY